jgi:hypothetical protein
MRISRPAGNGGRRPRRGSRPYRRPRRRTGSVAADNRRSRSIRTPASPTRRAPPTPSPPRVRRSQNDPQPRRCGAPTRQTTRTAPDRIPLGWRNPSCFELADEVLLVGEYDRIRHRQVITSPEARDDLLRREQGLVRMLLLEIRIPRGRHLGDRTARGQAGPAEHVPSCPSRTSGRVSST